MLRSALKALNDKMGPEGIITSRIAIGTLPTLPSGGIKKPRQKERMDVLKTAREEMQKITEELRIKYALNSRLPPATKFDFKAGQRVRVYREAS